ncbi:MAG: DUF4065 domain-containing protein [Dysgonamonadaceae bacterium]|jgi:uncharacterized phage-associated protein|nr:DUF4065 domain-containing protein [Dysgonamonadaceae bacterium]
MCYVSSTIAGYFIEKSNKESAPLSVLQLIKLVYISHGWNLVLNDTPLISDRIEAWKYGPVMPSLHSLFEGQNLTKDDLIEDFLIEEANCIKFVHRILLNKVYAKYKHLTGDEFTNLMHQKDTPWYSVWDNGAGKDHPINNAATKLYYSHQINKTTFDSLPEYPSIESKEEAVRFLIKSGILLEDGNLNPIYKNS